jgi:hypothetical protein
VAHPHEVAGALLGEEGGGELHHGEHLLLRLPHGQAPDGVPRQIKAEGLQGGKPPELWVRPPLGDAEKGLVGPGLGLQAPFQPAQGSFQGGLKVLPGGGVGRALVKGHDEVRPQGLLDGDAPLGGKLHQVPVEVALEDHAPLVNAAQVAQAHHLEAPGVREPGALPAGEAVKSPKGPHPFGPRAQEEVVGVGQEDLAPDFLQVPGEEALDRALGAHGHEEGGFHGPVGGGEEAHPGPAGAGRDLEPKGAHASFGAKRVLTYSSTSLRKSSAMVSPLRMVRSLPSA